MHNVHVWFTLDTELYIYVWLDYSTTNHLHTWRLTSSPQNVWQCRGRCNSQLRPSDFWLIFFYIYNNLLVLTLYVSYLGTSLKYECQINAYSNSFPNSFAYNIIIAVPLAPQLLSKTNDATTVETEFIRMAKSSNFLPNRHSPQQFKFFDTPCSKSLSSNRFLLRLCWI